MKRLVIGGTLAIALGLVCPVGEVLAQASDAESKSGSDAGPAVERELRGRHSINLSLGLLTDMQADPGGVRANGMLGGLGYMYWPASTWSVEVTASVHDARADVVNTSSVVSLLFGADWYPRALAFGPGMRAYAGAATGPYMLARTDPGGARTRTVLGARLGGGVDAFPASWLRLGLRGAYHLAPDFDQRVPIPFGEPAGYVRSPRGPQLSLELGVLFGGRR